MKQKQQQQPTYYVLDIRRILYIISTFTTPLFLPNIHISISSFYTTVNGKTD